MLVNMKPLSWNKSSSRLLPGPLEQIYSPEAEGVKASSNEPVKNKSNNEKLGVLVGQQMTANEGNTACTTNSIAHTHKHTHAMEAVGHTGKGKGSRSELPVFHQW